MRARVANPVPRRPVEDFKHVQALCSRALLRGALMVSPTRIRWDCSRGCERPRRIVRHAQPGGVVAPGKPKPLELTIVAPCAQCTRKHRKRRWEARVVAESASTLLEGKRIWGVTLTCSPDYLYSMTCRASTSRAGQGENFESLPHARQFRAKDAEIYRDIQRFLKRLRKGSPGSPGVSFRHCTVTEAHRSGEPHYHMLIHETDGSIPWLAFESARWNGGFFKARLGRGEPRKQTYSLKYLLKQGGRVRASRGYGAFADGSKMQRGGPHRQQTGSVEELPLKQGFSHTSNTNSDNLSTGPRVLTTPPSSRPENTELRGLGSELPDVF